MDDKIKAGLDAAMAQARDLDAMAVRLMSEATLLRDQASLLRVRALDMADKATLQSAG